MSTPEGMWHPEPCDRRDRTTVLTLILESRQREWAMRAIAEAEAGLGDITRK